MTETVAAPIALFAARRFDATMRPSPSRLAVIAAVSLLWLLIVVPKGSKAQPITPPPNATTVFPATTVTALPSTTPAVPTGPTPSPNATDAHTPAPPSGAPSSSSQSLQWYHVAAGVLGLFLLVGGACYVTLMWQQNAIRDYKNSFEEVVKKVGLMRSELADALKKEEGAAGSMPMRRVVDRSAVEDVRGVTDAAVGSPASGTAADGGVPMPVAATTASSIGVGKLHTYSMRTSRAAAEQEERAAQALEMQMRREAREAEVEHRRRNAGADLLQHSIDEAVAVNTRLAHLERTAQWRSLRSLDL
jgi:hypothetical protein